MQLIARTRSRIKVQCLERINTFVHRDALHEEELRAMVNEVVGVHGEAPIWHAPRTGGFASPEIRVQVHNFQGARADQQISAHEIVAGQQLRFVQEMDTDLKPLMSRGVDAERTYDLLVARGVDAVALITEQVRMASAKHLKESAAYMVAKAYPPVPPAVSRDLDEGLGEAANGTAHEGHLDERHAPRMTA
jgi:hypothetical protein